MKRSIILPLIGVAAVVVVTGACVGTVVPSPTATGSAPATDSPSVQPAPATATPGAPTPRITPELTPLPLGELGPYHVGTRTIAARDARRGDRAVNVTVWYPAVPPPEANPWWPTPDATPDPAGAPYPLILSSTKVARILAPYLVSRGFAWASVDGLDSYPEMDEAAIFQPLDILFALDRVADDPPEGLDGLIDTERAGAIGYSFDGFNALAMSGARIDPAYYRAQCPTPDATTQEILGGRLSSFSCGLADRWDSFAAQMGEPITASSDGLWQPLTDRRIRAVMPLAAEGWWLFGERGLAAADRPMLMLVATGDELYQENLAIHEHLGTSEKALISFVGPDHLRMVEDRALVARMAHFAAAFFGRHLQGREDLARFYTPAFVAQFDDLAWGASTGG